MLMPKRVKHRKVQRGRRAGMAKGGTTVSFGDYGLMAEEVSATLCVGIETVRTHIRQIYAKMGVKSREAMFRRVLPFCW